MQLHCHSCRQRQSTIKVCELCAHYILFFVQDSASMARNNRQAKFKNQTINHSALSSKSFFKVCQPGMGGMRSVSFSPFSHVKRVRMKTKWLNCYLSSTESCFPPKNLMWRGSSEPHCMLQCTGRRDKIHHPCFETAEYTAGGFL